MDRWIKFNICVNSRKDTRSDRANIEKLSIDRARFIQEMKDRNIGTSVHFIPLHMHPYYRDRFGYKPEDFPNAKYVYERIISLPIYPRMGQEDVQDVIWAVKDIVAKYRK